MEYKEFKQAVKTAVETHDEYEMEHLKGLDGRWFEDIMEELKTEEAQNMNNPEVIIKNYVVRDRHFTIVLDGGLYQAIEDKYIDENGRLTKTLYGHQTFANEDLNMCLNNTKNMVEIDYLVSRGHSKAEAFGMVFNLIGKVDMAQLEALFA